LADLEDNYK